MGALYQISFPSGRSYIGMTEMKPERRFLDHRYHARKGHKGVICDALRKYGIENAAFKVLVVANGRDYLSDLERRAIVAFGTRAPHGYNATDGGDGAPRGHKYRVGMKHTEASKLKMSVSQRAKPYRHSAESKARIGAASRGNQYGRRKHSEAEILARVKGCRGIFKGASSGHIGVSFHKDSGKWRAYLILRTKFIHLGQYSSMTDAIAARAAGERKYFL